MLVILLIIFLSPTSAKVAKFDPSVYREDVITIVDETMRKIKNPHLRKKLLTLERELDLEVERQNKLRR